jgi:hypothetical protein
VDERKYKDQCFEIHVPGRIYFLVAEDRVDRRRWIEGLEKIRRSSDDDIKLEDKNTPFRDILHDEAVIPLSPSSLLFRHEVYKFILLDIKPLKGYDPRRLFIEKESQ